MTSNLPAIPQKAKALWRIVKGAGPLLLALSTQLSKAFAQHQLRLAEVEAIKELMIAEAKTITEVRKQLIDRYIAAAPEDRLRLRHDIEMAEKDLRQLRVYQRAIEYIPENQATSGEGVKESLDPPEEFHAWLDTFNEYARKRSEPWRAELLARALALESSNPGALGQRALWFIGTFDERAFHAFASVLDIAPKIGGAYLIPNYTTYIGRKIPDCVLGSEITLGNLLFILGDLGLIGDLLQSEKHFPENCLLLASYGNLDLVARTTQQIRLGGVIFTSLGDTIAKLYEPKSNALGCEIYSKWLNDHRSKLQIAKETLI